MSEDFFLGFPSSAHTKNDLVADPNLALQLRKENSTQEAQRLTSLVLDKIEDDIISAGYELKDVKLLILYVSYRGDTSERDKLISESILKTIAERFKG